MGHFILTALRGRAVAPDHERAGIEIQLEIPSDELEEIIAMAEYERPSNRASVHVGGQGVLLEYDGGTRGPGLRPVSVGCVERIGDMLYLQGFCHLSGQPKRFRGDRLLAIVDPGTGETFRDVASWMDSEPASDIQLLRQLRTELVLLAFLARADGKVCDAELDQIELFLDHAAIDAGCRCPPRLAIERMALGLAPEWTSASRSCAQLAKAPARAAHTWRTIRKLVDADGLLHEGENAALAEVAEALGAL